MYSKFVFLTFLFLCIVHFQITENILILVSEYVNWNLTYINTKISKYSNLQLFIK